MTVQLLLNNAEVQTKDFPCVLCLWSQKWIVIWQLQPQVVVQNASTHWFSLGLCEFTKHPLVSVAEGNHVECVSLLLNEGVEVNLPNVCGAPPLQRAAQWGQSHGGTEDSHLCWSKFKCIGEWSDRLDIHSLALSSSNHQTSAACGCQCEGIHKEVFPELKIVLLPSGKYENDLEKEQFNELKQLGQLTLRTLCKKKSGSMCCTWTTATCSSWYQN